MVYGGFFIHFPQLDCCCCKISCNIVLTYFAARQKGFSIKNRAPDCYFQILQQFLETAQLHLKQGAPTHLANTFISLFFIDEKMDALCCVTV